MPSDTPQHVLLTALRRLLRPLVRILLRHGVAFSDFAEVARASYVEVANEEFPPPGRKQSLSHVAVLTGVHRHEVKRVLETLSAEPTRAPQHNRAARVINGWLNDPDFSDAGVPHVLNVDDGFKSLVARYSGDITPRPILDELVRVGAVERDQEHLALVTKAYVPYASDTDMLHIFGECVADLIATVNHNLTHTPDQQRLQISVVHDNLPDEVMRQVEIVSRDKAMDFLRDLNQFIESQDRDANPAIEGSGRNRAGVGLYFFSDSMPADNTDAAVVGTSGASEREAS